MTVNVIIILTILVTYGPQSKDMASHDDAARINYR